MLQINCVHCVFNFEWIYIFLLNRHRFILPLDTFLRNFPRKAEVPPKRVKGRKTNVCLEGRFVSIQKLKMALITKLAPWQIPNAVMSEWLRLSLYASQWVTAVKFHEYNHNNSLAKKKKAKYGFLQKQKIRIKDYRLATSHLPTFKAMQPVHQYPLGAELIATSTKVVVRSQHAACGCSPAQVRSTRGCCCSVAVLQNWNV